MKRFLLVIVILLSLIGVGYCADSTQVGFWASIWIAIKTEFLPVLKNQLFPLLFDSIQSLIQIVVLAIVAFIATWLQSKINNAKIQEEIENGETALKTGIIASLNNPKYKAAKDKYVKGEITVEQFMTEVGPEFKDALLNSVTNKMTSLGKTLVELATVKFGDGKKYLENKFEELLMEAKKK
jgi:uncharacterized membrane protein